MYILIVKIPMNNKWFVVCQGSRNLSHGMYISSTPTPALIVQFEAIRYAEEFAREYLHSQDEIKIVRMTQKSLYRRFKSREYK
jgi:hypothetical protein